VILSVVQIDLAGAVLLAVNRAFPDAIPSLSLNKTSGVLSLLMISLRVLASFFLIFMGRWG
jgi:hypothetical protein